MEKRIILASQSPRRKELLAGLGLSFIVKASSVDEEQVVADLAISTPEELVRTLSYVKAKDVAKDVTEGIVIGADTIVVLGDEILGKPKNQADAKQMIQKLSGKTHLVISGVTIIDVEQNTYRTEHVTTEVDFKEISASEIEGYLTKANYLDKAGSYAVQEHGALFVSGIRGCFFNVVGLPIYTTGEMLKEFQVKVL